MNAITEFPVLSTVRSYTQLELEYDPELKTLFSWMKPEPRPCFTKTLLEEVQHLERLLESNQGHLNHQGHAERVAYLVAGSRATGAFNLGGDLAMFIQAIMRKDRELLSYYGHLCVENIERRLTGLGASIPTIALVQGKCFGGGFECALTSEVIVAERCATFSFPEIIFNLIPGMGGLLLLKRRVGLKKAEEIIMSGRVFSAKEMYDLDVVDIVAEDGFGLEAVRKHIQHRERKPIAYRTLFHAKQVCEPITKEQLLGIVDLWVDATMQLETRDLRMMARLLRSQDKMVATRDEESSSEALYASEALVAVGAD
jgi:DSF synthase